ncbi:MAG: HD domain-containing protein [bacterium]
MGSEAGRKYIRDLEVGEKVTDFFVVKSKRNLTTRNNKPYLDVDLADRSGQVNGKVWDRAEELSDLFQRGDVIKVKAMVEQYMGKKQLKISDLRPVGREEELDWESLIKKSTRDAEDMVSELRELCESLESAPLRELMEAFFEDREFMEGFKISAAARNVHHVYQGGLVEHTLNVTRIALSAYDLYGEDLDRDMLIAGCILHDAGKIRELDSRVEIGYTDEGYLVGHLALGSAMLREKAATIPELPEDLLMELDHIILSHHGEKEWGSPVVPMTPEAMIVHCSDQLEAKTKILLTSIEEDPNQDEEFTQYHRTLARHFYKRKARRENRES